ncbi:hypothetical protein ACFQJC_09170 [Haloferax namakaokahaiae]|uniref:C2H2-type domain-containing protein n=1 Tax=Haloferax namakaokahaiae TaxID=1748331 RepID=A0ABD5ZEX0_9EURY
MSSTDERRADFTCDLCGEHFDTKAELLEHVSVYHEIDSDERA